MKAITRIYLNEFIFRLINTNIDIYRRSKEQDTILSSPHATEEEVLEFIRSIPYFDNRLKDFMAGNLCEHTIIISQQWETAFTIKCRAWADSYEWLHGDRHYLSDLYLDKLRRTENNLGLPY